MFSMPPKAVTPLESSNSVIHACGHSGFYVPKVSPGSGFRFIFEDKQKQTNFVNTFSVTAPDLWQQPVS